MKEGFKYSEKLTTELQELFGELNGEPIVKAVYYGEVYTDYKGELCGPSEDEFLPTKLLDWVSVDANAILIEFTTGKRVRFSTSEWGSISRDSDLVLIK